MKLVIAGKPGSGKGTQAELLSAQLNIRHLSSGEMLRAEIRLGTPLGKKVESYIRRGEIGPAELITDIVLEHIEREGLEGGYLLDGFPRTLYQARNLEERYPPAGCIHLAVPDQIVHERLPARLSCIHCGAIYHATEHLPFRQGICNRCGSPVEPRPDDDETAILRRIETFRREVLPVLNLYEQSGRLIEVDGAKPPDLVLRSIVSSLEGLHA